MRSIATRGILVLSLALIGCTDTGNPGMELGGDAAAMPDYAGRPDIPGQGDVFHDGSQGQDLAHSDDSITAPDSETLDHGFQDPGPGDTASQQDEGTTTDTGLPAVIFCRRTDSCMAGEVCNLSTGRCERRGVALGGPFEVWNFEPRVAAQGDVLVVDGQSFYSNIIGSLNVKVLVAGKAIGGSPDENRITARLVSFTTGQVSVSGSNGTAHAPGLITPGPAGIVPCDPESPTPSAGPFLEPADSGTYAAGFVDFTASGAGRVFYPATCGGVRRPVAEGTFPVVVICHGDGAVPLNYEYLGQHLATWGFVSLIPDTSDPAQIAALANNPASAFDGPVAAPPLDLSLGVVLVGHSMGTNRIEQAQKQFNKVAGVVYLGPVNRDQVPAVPLLYFGATNDLQSKVGDYAPRVYGKHPGPKIQVVIQGGNHSGFTDHKVWQGFLSDKPLEIERSRQHVLVQQFTLPFVQKYLGADQPFADYLQTPPQDPDYTFLSAP